MTDSLRDQLQASLGTAYTLERELGGGGMSRVFVAREEALGRDVVVKVLAPELAEGLSAERFAREIKLAAALQEPHIVPVHTAGVMADGLPYYTMPYVRGESLRARLSREPVPLSEAIAILLDVATALEYAHGRGLVHRDIKPENVLLSGRTAVVTDFGIAKALQQARTVAADGPAQATSAGLTQLGTSLGTPAYMAPEQAAGDPATDHRADIYAWGVIAYELLAGRHPFHGKTSPQALMAAHFGETPAPLPKTSSRALAALIARCLEKDPDRRPQTVREVVEALGAGSVTRSESKVGRWAAGAVGALLLVVGVTAGMRALSVGPFSTLLSAGTLDRDQPLVVSEFTVNNSPDTTLGKVIAEAVRADLSQSNAFSLMPAVETQRALADMRLPNARLLLPVAREVAQRKGAKAVVDGTLQPLGAGFVVTLRVVAADSGRELVSVTDAADSPSQLIRVVGGLTRKLRGKIGESLKSVTASPPLWEATTSSLAALQIYTQGRQALNSGREEDYDRLLKEAVAIDANFGAAYISLASNRINAQSHLDEAARYLARVHALRDRLSDRDRWTGESYFYAFGPVETRDPARSLAFDDSLVQRYTTGARGALAKNNQGLRYLAAGEFVRAESTLRVAAKLDSAAAYAISNIINVQLQTGRHAAADSTVESVKERFSRPVVEGWQWRVLAGSGAITQAESVSLARYARATTPAQRVAAATDLAALDAQQGRLKDALRFYRLVVDLESRQGNPTRAIAVAGQEAESIMWMTSDPSTAVATVDSVLARIPLDSLAELDRPYVSLAQVFAMAGQVPRARRYLEGIVRQRVDGEFRYGWALPVTRARIAMAEKRSGDAVRIMSEVGADLCQRCMLLTRAMAYDGHGDADSAIVTYERYLQPLVVRGAPLAPVQRRLGELYEAKGDVGRARRWYEQFLESWKHADPELRPQLQDVERRVSRLRAREAARR